MNSIVPQQSRPQRGAMVLICVLACMAIVTALVASSMQMALQTRRAMHAQHQLRQVELLLEAGVDRAARQLANDPEYSGESWHLLPETLATADKAFVKIDVSDDDDTWPPEVTVVASLAVSEAIRIKRSHTFSLDISLSPLGD